VAIQHDTARHEELAGKVGRLGTELADCLAESYSIGHEAPDYVVGALLDLESWARELRGDLYGPTALLAHQARERRVTALQPDPDEDQGDDLAAVIPLPLTDPQPTYPALLVVLGLFCLAALALAAWLS
jgi:hypothetical protein